MNHALAMSIAWEQVAYWRGQRIRAHEAAEMLGLAHRLPTWDDVARQLARMWLSIQQPTDERQAA